MSGFDITDSQWETNRVDLLAKKPRHKAVFVRGLADMR